MQNIISLQLYFITCGGNISPVTWSTNNLEITLDQPVPTNTPVPTPEPTATPKPTKIPTQTKVPTPTKIPTPTPNPTITTEKYSSSDDTVKKTLTYTSDQYQNTGIPEPASVSGFPTLVLGISTKSAEKVSSVSSQRKEKRNSVKDIPKTLVASAVAGPAAIIASGVLLCICGILIYLKKRMQNNVY